MCASLLNRGTTLLHGISRIEEVYRMIEILESIGVKISWIGEHNLKIIPPREFKMDNLNIEAAIKTRSIIMLAGPLIHHLPSFSLPHAQGCKLGKRSISAHIFGLEELGAKVKVANDAYYIILYKIK